MIIPNPINAIKAGLRWLAFVIRNRSIKASFVEDDVFIDRMVTCLNCPENENGQCKKCTCVIRVKAKLKTEACPIQKWMV